MYQSGRTGDEAKNHKSSSVQDVEGLDPTSPPYYLS